MDKQDRNDLIDALDCAIKDSTEYLAGPYASRDYAGDEEGLAEFEGKVKRWTNLIINLENHND